MCENVSIQPWLPIRLDCEIYFIRNTIAVDKITSWSFVKSLKAFAGGMFLFKFVLLTNRSLRYFVTSGFVASSSVLFQNNYLPFIAIVISLIL